MRRLSCFDEVREPWKTIQGAGQRSQRPLKNTFPTTKIKSGSLEANNNTTRLCASPETYYPHCFLSYSCIICQLPNAIHRIIESMPVQHSPTPPAASSSHDRLDPSEYPHSAASFDYSVVDWFSGLVASQDLRPSDGSYPKSSFSSHSTKSTTDSHERRQNPKLIKSNAGSRAVSLSSGTLCDKLVVDYKYRIHTKELGHLYGLCDAVPYLLGPRSYLQAIEAFGNYPIPMEANRDHKGNFVLDPDKITTPDKVFMTMLWLLNASVDRRPADWEEFYTGLSVQDDRLIVYKDVGFGT